MIKISEIREEDREVLRNLFFRTRLATFSWADSSEIKLSDFEVETKGEYILAASIDEMIIGFISVWRTDNFIHHLYVDEQFQNQRVGTQLLNAAIAKLDFPVRLKCEENNVTAVRFYKQRGFVEKERGESGKGPYILFELQSPVRSGSATGDRNV